VNKISPKVLGPLLILLGVLPLLIFAVRFRNIFFPRATYTGIPARVAISPGDIPTAGGIITPPGSSTPLYLSTTAVDTGGTYLNSGVTYVWGISSTTSIGDLIVRDNTAIATFIPNSTNPGIGDLWVTAITPSGQATSSVKICVGLPCPVSAPTPTPTNNPPSITTASLPALTLGQAYSATLEATDPDPDDRLTAIVNLPSSGLQSLCATSTTSPSINCSITGTLTSSSGYSVLPVSFTVTDNHGLQTQSDYTLSILTSPTPPPSPTPTPYIEVLAPNGGEDLTIDQPFTIKWRSGSVNNFIIYLTNSLGQETLINGASSPSASYEWTVNSPIMSDTKLHKIKIIDSTPVGTEATAQDQSDSFFTISSCSRAQPTLILTPNSQSGTPGETLTYDINLTNNDSVPCPSIPFLFSYPSNQSWTGRFSSTSTEVAPNHSYQNQLQVTTSISDFNPGSKPITISATSDSPTLSLQASATYVLLQAGDFNPGSKPITISATSDSPTLSLQASATYVLLQAGDFNHNSQVDIYDFAIFVADFGKTDSPADLNGNGKVDIFDFAILVANFGT